MRSTLNKVPAFPVAAGWSAGVLLWWEGCDWWLVVVSIVIGVMLMLLRKQYVAIGMYAAAAGWVVALLNTPQEPPVGVFDGENRTYSGMILDVRTSQNSQQMLIRIDSIERIPFTPFVVKSVSLPEWIAPRIGATVRLSAVLEPLDCAGDFVCQYDSSISDLRSGVVAQTYIEGDSMIVTGHHKSFGSMMYDRRMAIVSALAHTDLSEKAYGLLCAIITGYGDELDVDIRENFRITGLSHTLALSGFHVGIIALLSSVLFFPICALSWHRPVRYLALLTVMWLYAALTGMSDSVVRAVLMFSVFVVCRLVGRRPNGYNAMFVAVLVILAVSPYSIFSPGLQLSVSAVAGILAFNVKLNPVDPRNHTAYAAMQYLTVPLSAVIGTLPVTILYFNQLPLVFIVSNVIVTLLLPLLMIGGIVIILAALMGIGSAWLCAAVNGLVEVITEVAASLAELPFAGVSVYFTGYQCALLAVAILCIAVSLYVGRLRERSGALGMAVLCAVLMPLSGRSVSEEDLFIVRTRANTPVVMRKGSKAVVRFTCHPDRMDVARRNLERALSDYTMAYGIDTLQITSGDVAIGSYVIKDDILTANGRRVAILQEGHRNDSMAMPADIALICSRYRGSVADALRLTGADTLLLSRDLSLKRARRLAGESPVPVIDMRKDPYFLRK